MNYRKFAAIDIGSNAVRLLIANVLEYDNGKVEIKKNSLVRVPIRLGADVFTKGHVGIRLAGNLIDAMQAFTLLMRVHKVEEYRAFATSAVRDAENGQELVERVLEKTDVKIEVIDGDLEAEIIALNNLNEHLEEDKQYLFIDVGGGSTEYTLMVNGKVEARKSFKFGAVRFINGLVTEEMFREEVKPWIKEITKGLSGIITIGSGGNINTLYKMADLHRNEPMSYDYIKEQYDLLKELSYDERMEKFEMNPDRADVILPATYIYAQSMKWAESTEMKVPRIGLADGTILYICKEKGIL